MTYNIGDLDYDTGGGFGPYEATVKDAGVGISKYGPEILLVVMPTNSKRMEQHLHMSIGKGDFVLAGDKRTIVTGRGERAFETVIQNEIESGPKIKVMSNGGLFLNALKHLGFALSGGDVSSCIGLKLDLEEITANEAIRGFNETHSESPLDERTGDYAKGKLTIPIRLISMPIKKVSLKEAVLKVIEGKTETIMVEWYKGTEFYDGTATTPLYRVLSELEKSEVLVVNGLYMVKKGGEV